MNEDDPQEFPRGFKWYGEWQNALLYLPRACHLPVEVDIGGSTEFRLTVSGDWRQVARWRRVQLTQGELRRLRKALKIEAQEVEMMG